MSLSGVHNNHEKFIVLLNGLVTKLGDETQAKAEIILGNALNHDRSLPDHAAKALYLEQAHKACSISLLKVKHISSLYRAAGILEENGCTKECIPNMQIISEQLRDLMLEFKETEKLLIQISEKVDIKENDSEALFRDLICVFHDWQEAIKAYKNGIIAKIEDYSL